MSKTKTIVYNQEDLMEITPVPNLSLSDIEAEKCFRPKDGSHYLVFHCKPTTKYAGACPSCGCIGREFKNNGHTSKPRIVHDVPVGVENIDLIVKVPRYICRDCGAIFAHKFESICEGKQCTKRLLEKIQRDCFRIPFSDISIETGYTVTTIAEIFDEYIDMLEANQPPIIAPEVLSLDEKHIVHSMRAIFVDNKTGRLLQMTEDNKRDTIIKTIESMVDYDKNIRIVTTDMTKAYRSAIQECLPYAKIVIDKFHIFQELYRKISKTKTIIMEDIRYQIENALDLETSNHLREVRDMIVRNSYLFKFGKHKLAADPKRLRILADACKTFPELNHLRLIKEGFERIYDSQSRHDAESRFLEWTKLIPPKNKQDALKWSTLYGVRASVFLTELSAFLRTINNWREEIFAYFDENCHFTNAVAEGTNCMIQRINAQGNGYGFKHLRAKAMFWHVAGSNTVYKFRTTKEPIYEVNCDCATNTPIFNFTTISNHSWLDNLSIKVKGYKDVCRIEAETIGEAHTWSVATYAKYAKDFYDFDDLE